MQNFLKTSAKEYTFEKNCTKNAVLHLNISSVYVTKFADSYWKLPSEFLGFTVPFTRLGRNLGNHGNQGDHINHGKSS